MAEYEFHHFELASHASRGAVRQVLTDQAEYGGWELARLRRYPDGRRKVTMRRRIIRVSKTLAPRPTDRRS